MIDEKLLMELLQAEKSKNQVIDDYTHGIQTGLRRAIKLTYDQPKVGWIPVGEELPIPGLVNPNTRNYQQYICCMKYMEITELRILGFSNKCKWVSHGSDLTEYIVARMPLPEPFKEERDV